MQTLSSKPARHVKVQGKGVDHLYYSVKADGTKVYEIRHKVNGEGKRLFQTVGPNLAAAKRQRDLLFGTGISVDSVGTTLNEVIENWRVAPKKMRPRTIETFEKNLRLHIVPVLGNRKVREISQLVIENWVAGLTKKDGSNGPMAEGTKRQVYECLHVILKHAKKMHAIIEIPSIDDKPKQEAGRMRILTRDEEDRLIAYCAPFPWMVPIIDVTVSQGLRLGEVLGLRWEDVDFAENKLHVRRTLHKSGDTGPTKSGKPRTIRLSDRARKVLIELRMDEGDGFIFRNQLGGTRQLRDVQRAFDKARTRAALTVNENGPITFHSLRHTTASRMVNGNVPLATVRDFLGHSSVEITNGYLHPVEDEAVNNAIDAAVAVAA